MIIEALINLNDIGDEKNWAPGDIIMIRPVGWNWGIGDLQSRIVVQIDMPDFPCGVDFFIKKKCVNCEHHGIVWPSELLVIGVKGTPKVSCIKEQYEATAMNFIFSFSPQGFPFVTTDMQARRMGKVLVDMILSAKSIIDITKEISITEAERDAKLLITRDIKNLVTMDKLEVKTFIIESK